MSDAATGGGPMSGAKRPDIYIRPEFEVDTLGEADIGDVERKLSWIERVWNVNGVRKATILIGLVVAWQIYTVVSGRRAAHVSAVLHLGRGAVAVPRRQ